jgi:hypothetical protein
MQWLEERRMGKRAPDAAPPVAESKDAARSSVA